MQHERPIPVQVLEARLADGATVAIHVGDETPSVRQLPDSAVDGFRNVWIERRDFGFPALAGCGRISDETVNRWSARVTALLAFVDGHRMAGLVDYTFLTAKVSVLYSPADDAAFAVDLEPPGHAGAGPSRS
jgi:hypothetical protein